MKKTLLLPVVALHCAILTLEPGCKKKEEQGIQPSISPIVAFVNYPESFSSSARVGDKVFWEFGDGATSYELHPLHTYTSAGTYNVRLTANGVLATTPATVRQLPDSLALATMGGMRYWHGTSRWHGRYGLAHDTTINIIDSPIELKIIDRGMLCIGLDTFRLQDINTLAKSKYYYYLAYENFEVTSHQGSALVSWCYIKYYYDENKITWVCHPFFEHLSGMTEATGTTTELTTP